MDTKRLTVVGRNIRHSMSTSLRGKGKTCNTCMPYRIIILKGEVSRIWIFLSKGKSPSPWKIFKEMEWSQHHRPAGLGQPPSGLCTGSAASDHCSLSTTGRHVAALGCYYWPTWASHRQQAWPRPPDFNHPLAKLAASSLSAWLPATQAAALTAASPTSKAATAGHPPTPQAGNSNGSRHFL